jgi:hypothetical protein
MRLADGILVDGAVESLRGGAAVEGVLRHIANAGGVSVATARRRLTARLGTTPVAWQRELGVLGSGRRFSWRNARVEFERRRREAGVDLPIGDGEWLREAVGMLLGGRTVASVKRHISDSYGIPESRVVFILTVHLGETPRVWAISQRGKAAEGCEPVIWRDSDTFRGVGWSGRVRTMAMEVSVDRRVEDRSHMVARAARVCVEPCDEAEVGPVDLVLDRLMVGVPLAKALLDASFSSGVGVVRLGVLLSERLGRPPGEWVRCSSVPVLEVGRPLSGSMSWVGSMIEGVGSGLTLAEAAAGVGWTGPMLLEMSVKHFGMSPRGWLSSTAIGGGGG